MMYALRGKSNRSKEMKIINYLDLEEGCLWLGRRKHSQFLSWGGREGIGKEKGSEGSSRWRRSGRRQWCLKMAEESKLCIWCRAICGPCLYYTALPVPVPPSSRRSLGGSLTWAHSLFFSFPFSPSLSVGEWMMGPRVPWGRVTHFLETEHFFWVRAGELNSLGSNPKFSTS